MVLFVQVCVLICCGSGAVASGLGVNPGLVGAASGLASFMQMAGAAATTAALSFGDLSVVSSE